MYREYIKDTENVDSFWMSVFLLMAVYCIVDFPAFAGIFALTYFMFYLLEMNLIEIIAIILYLFVLTGIIAHGIFG